MFGSQILEVGIGLILVFLLVGLVLTAVRETLEAWMKTRSRDLERALAELLDDKDGTGARLELYRHPLIQALYSGEPSPTAFSNGKVVERVKSNLPSYIPRETFAFAVEDLVKSGSVSGRVSAVYDALLRAEGADPIAARRRLEQWYDAAMDRASGWYRRRTQKILLVLGMLVAVVLNINAIAIGQYLATNEIARTQMVQIADNYLNEQQAADAASCAQNHRLRRPSPTPRTQPPMPPTRTRREPTPAPIKPAQPTRSSNGTEISNAAEPAVADNAAAEPAAGSNAVGGNAVTQPAAGVEAANAAHRLNSLISVVGLPVGWNQFQWERMKAEWERDPWLALLSWIFGWLIVGFAATLGAPFWFDLLGKFMVIRSTVKPTEKSPDEASKDGGTGGAPQPAPDAAAAGGGGAAPPGPR